MNEFFYAASQAKNRLTVVRRGSASNNQRKPPLERGAMSALLQTMPGRSRRGQLRCMILFQSISNPASCNSLASACFQAPPPSSGT